MKKIIIALIVLLLAAGGSIGAFLYAKNKKNEDDKAAEAKKNDKILFDFDSHDINKIEFDLADGSKYVAELDENSKWKLTEGADFIVDQDYFTIICTYVSSLKAVTSYDMDEDKLASYGLDKPNVITLFSDDNSYSLNAGTTLSPTGDYYYISLDDRDKVYMIEALYGSVFQTNHLMMRSKHLIPYTDSDIAGFSVKKDGKEVYSLTYDKESSTWSLPEEYSSLPLDPTLVTSEKTTMTRLVADISNMLEEYPKDLSKYGLDKPEYTAVIKSFDGTERNLRVNTKYDPNNQYSCIYNEEDDVVMLLFTNDISFITNTPKNYISDIMEISSINKISSLDYTFNGVETNIVINTDENNLNVNGQSIDLTNCKSAIKNFVDALTNVKIADVDIYAEPELKDPLLTAVLHQTEGGDVTYQLTDAGNDLYYVFINGKYSKAVTGKSTLNGKNSVPYFFDEFKVAAGIE
jgi:hypothetical protein